MRRPAKGAARSHAACGSCANPGREGLALSSTRCDNHPLLQPCATMLAAQACRRRAAARTRLCGGCAVVDERDAPGRGLRRDRHHAQGNLQVQVCGGGARRAVAQVLPGPSSQQQRPWRWRRRRRPAGCWLAGTRGCSRAVGGPQPLTWPAALRVRIEANPRGHRLARGLRQRQRRERQVLATQRLLAAAFCPRHLHGRTGG